MRITLFSSLIASSITFVLCTPSISTFPNTLSLSSPFDPIQAAYWTNFPHHRRTPYSVSPDGKSAYLAYLDSGKKNVFVQQVDVNTFTAVGTAVSVPGFEAAGLVAKNDGFALLATVKATGTTDLPSNDYPIVALIRFKGGVEAWRTLLNGPGVHPEDGLTATPDANGDLVFSEASGLYAAYFVVTAYTGRAAGHYGDSIQYVNDAGVRQDIPQASTFGCSHNTGIGLEAADAPPFASICAEDHGSIWLNTDTRTMNGVKIANENVTNGVSGEPMGGMSGSYSNLARFPSTAGYIFAWQSRGALDLTLDTWLGAPNTQSSPRWLNHNVAVATLSSKNKLTGPEAISVVGAKEGDLQVNWITKSTTEDHQNVHVAALNSDLSVVTWETLTSPKCEPVPLSCSGTYAGTTFQLIDSKGAKVGEPVTSTKAFVSGDMALVGTDKVCWPYVDMVWDLSAPKSSGAAVSKMSFACASVGDGSVASSSAAAPSSTSVSSTAAVSSAATTSAISPATTVSDPSVSSEVSPEEVPSLAPTTLITTTVVPVAPSSSAKSTTRTPLTISLTSSVVVVLSSSSSIPDIVGPTSIPVASKPSSSTSTRVRSTRTRRPIQWIPRPTPVKVEDDTCTGN